jgi:hypothetical protein
MPAAGLRTDIRWLSSGFVLTLYSGFGQTYFIALFAGQLKSELAITDGEFGSLYTIGTLASAALSQPATSAIGGIRSMVTAGVVVATAASPGLVGVLIDAGVPLEVQLLVMAAYCLVAALWMLLLIPRLDRLAAA